MNVVKVRNSKQLKELFRPDKPTRGRLYRVDALIMMPMLVPGLLTEF